MPSESSTARVIVDGGGTGTRLSYHALSGVTVEVAGEASALSLGVASAWQVIERLACRAAAEAGESLDWTRCALVAGLAGMNNKEWRDAFAAQAPACRLLVLESDAVTSLWGAHLYPLGRRVTWGLKIVANFVQVSVPIW